MSKFMACCSEEQLVCLLIGSFVWAYSPNALCGGRNINCNFGTYTYKTIFKQMKRIGLLSLFIALLFTTPKGLQAQLSKGGVPNINLSQLRNASTSLSVVTITPPSQKQIAQWMEASGDGFRNTYTIGIPQEVHITPENSGTRSVGESNNLVWQLVLESPGARGLQLFFSRFHLPEGACLYLFSPSTGEMKGAFGAHNNTEEACLAVAPVRGERIIVHYEAPANDFSLPDLTIGSISYCFRNIVQDPTNGVYTPGEPWFSGGYSCAPNVIEHQEVEEISRSQVLLIVRGRSVCSGALINNSAQDGTAYVLTAAHCMNGSFRFPNDKEYRDESARQTIFFFNFRSPVGNRLVRGTEEQSLSGATIVAWDEDHDLCLLRITGVQDTQGGERCGIPASYRPYFSGWNAGEHQPPYVGLHHPAASVTRYNQVKEKVQLASFAAGSMQWNNVHWKINKWDIGTTAPGSSGSPLYDNKNLIIGALTGGNSYCHSPFNDYYYAISLCWSPESVPLGGLALYLDPKNTKEKTCSGLDPYAPKSPQRLSNNLYSLSRDDIEQTNGKLEEVTALASQYILKDSSRLLGVMIVASPSTVFNRNKLLIMAGDEHGPISTLYTQEIKHPVYKYWDPADEGQERTIGGIIEFFVPLNEEVLLPKNTTLYVGVEAMEKGEEGGMLPIVRMRSSEQNAHSAWVKSPLVGNRWLPNNSSELPSNLYYRGNYWMDLLTLPLDEVGNNTPNRWDMPSIAFMGGRLRLTLPELPEGDVHLNLYSLEGTRFFTSAVNYKIEEFAVPSLPFKHSWIVAVVLYKGVAYSYLLPYVMP